MRPPRDRPIAWARSPFAATGGAMRLDRGGVDEKLRRRAASLRERVEEIDPHALGRPPDITVVERLPRPVFRRRVDPAPAGFQHVDNPADHAPIIDPRLAPRVSGEVRRNLRKLGVGQPKTVGNHWCFLSEAVNHDVALKPTTLWVRALVKNHMEGPKGFRAMLAGWVLCGFVKIVDDEIRFWNGSKIYLCHCKDEKDIYKYQGAEIHVLLIDELTHFTESMYRFLRNRVRMVGLDLPVEYAGLFPRIFCSANPGNIGHLWVKTTFVALGPFAIVQTEASEGGMRRQVHPGSARRQSEHDG